jgi:hypothetical protein
MTRIFIQGALNFERHGLVSIFEVIRLRNILLPSYRNLPWYPSSVLKLTRIVKQWVVLCPTIHNTLHLEGMYNYSITYYMVTSHIIHLKFTLLHSHIHIQ